MRGPARADTKTDQPAPQARSSNAAARPASKPMSTETVTIERLEAALLLLATLIELDGDIHVALFERLEGELAALRRVEDAKARARRLLESYSCAGDRKAIRSRNLSLSSSDGPRPYLGL